MELRPFPFVLLRSPVHTYRDRYLCHPERAPLFDEGIYLASAGLWKEWMKRDTLRTRDRAKLDLAIHKYWLRSCSRCTPYGSFAGCTIVPVTGDPTGIVLGPASQHIRKVRPDMHYLSEIIDALEEKPVIRRQLRFYTNNSLYRLPDGYRYSAYTITEAGREYHLMSVGKSSYIDSVLKSARTGATMAELAGLLVSSEAAGSEEAEGFIRELIESRILVSGLEPCLTGPEPLDALIRQMDDLKGVSRISESLRAAAVLSCSNMPGTAGLQRIEHLLAGVAPLSRKPGTTLQSDLYLSARIKSVNQSVITSICRQIQDLMPFSGPFRQPDLERFKTMFLERYEDAEIPLHIALDADLGIGYAGVHDSVAVSGSLTDTLQAAAGTEREDTSSQSHLRGMVAACFSRYMSRRDALIELTEEDLKRSGISSADLRLPGSMYLAGSLIGGGEAADPDQFSSFV